MLNFKKPVYTALLSIMSISSIYALNHYTIRLSTPIQLQQQTQTQAQKLSPVMYVNDTSGIIAFAEDKKQAEALSQSPVKVYYLIHGQTVSQTIERWAKANDYTVFFQADDDYQIQADAIIYGDFLGAGGALETLLNSLKTSAAPFKAEIMANNVILIKAATFNSDFLMPK